MSEEKKQEEEFLEKARIRVKSTNLNDSITQSKKFSEIQKSLRALLEKFVPEEEEEEEEEEGE